MYYVCLNNIHSPSGPLMISSNCASLWRFAYNYQPVVCRIQLPAFGGVMNTITSMWWCAEYNYLPACGWWCDEYNYQPVVVWRIQLPACGGVEHTISSLWWRDTYNYQPLMAWRIQFCSLWWRDTYSFQPVVAWRIQLPACGGMTHTITSLWWRDAYNYQPVVAWRIKLPACGGMTHMYNYQPVVTGHIQYSFQPVVVCRIQSGQTIRLSAHCTSTVYSVHRKVRCGLSI